MADLVTNLKQAGAEITPEKSESGLALTANRPDYSRWRNEMLPMPSSPFASKPNRRREAEEMKNLIAPFPYFGGKRSVAADVWARLGAPKQYIEPFCGSAAVLLAAPRAASLEHVAGFGTYKNAERNMTQEARYKTGVRVDVEHRAKAA